MSAAPGGSHSVSGYAGISEADLRETFEMVTTTNTLYVKSEHCRDFDPQVVLVVTKPHMELQVYDRDGDVQDDIASQYEAMHQLGVLAAGDPGADAIAAAFLVSVSLFKDPVTKRMSEILLTVGMRSDGSSRLAAVQRINRTDDGIMVLGEPEFECSSDSSLLREFFIGLEQGLLEDHEGTLFESHWAKLSIPISMSECG